MLPSRQQSMSFVPHIENSFKKFTFVQRNVGFLNVVSFATVKHDKFQMYE